MVGESRTLFFGTLFGDLNEGLENSYIVQDWHFYGVKSLNNLVNMTTPRSIVIIKM